MKKSLCLLMGLSFIFLIHIAIAQSTTNVYVNPAQTNVNLGDNFAVNIDVSTTDFVFAVDLYVYYNSSILSTAKSNVIEGPFLTKDVAQWSGYDTFTVISVINALGRIRYSATRYCDCAGIDQPDCQNAGICPIDPVGVDGTGTLFTVNFDTVSTGTSSLDLNNVILSDLDLQAISNVSVTNGSVKVNRAPSASNLQIKPASPKTTDNLEGSYNYSDPDGDPESGSEIRWYRNGLLESVYNDLLMVPSIATAKNQIWYFTVRPSDGIGFGDLETSPSVIIQNSPPTAPDVDVTPDSPKTFDMLTCTASGSTDPDSDPITYSYVWYKNGVLQSSQTESTVSLLFTAKGETWKCMVTPNDGTDDGPTGEDQVTVQNTVPVAIDLGITPWNPLTTDSLTGFYTYFDADTDPESGTQIRWYKNSVLQSAYNDLLTLPSSATAKGEEWQFTVRPSDGTVFFGFLKFSPIVTIQNSAPVFKVIDNQNVNETENLIFSVIAYDLDDDVLTISSTNLPDGAVLSECPWPCAIPFPYKICGCKQFNWIPTYDQAGTYEVTFNVSDGSLMDSETIMITVNNVNRAPIITSFTPASTTLETREGFSLQFNHSSTDPDGDPLTYSWKLDGLEKATTPLWLYSPTITDFGSRTVLLTVSDGLLTDTQSWTVDVGLRGDVDGDGDVDIFDLAGVGLCYGQPATGNCENADINPGPGIDGAPEGDGQIDIFDLATVGLNYGRIC